VVLSSEGEELWEMPVSSHDRPTFRFSTDGWSLALSSKKGFEVRDLRGRLRRGSVVPHLHGTWISDVKNGWLIRDETALRLLTDTGEIRKVSNLEKAATVVSCATNILVFGKNTLSEISPLDPALKARVSALPDEGRVANAAIAPTCDRVLFATQHTLYLREGDSRPTAIANLHDATTLSFSLDGKSYLWLGKKDASEPYPLDRGELNWEGKRFRLPEYIYAARFANGGSGFPVTTSTPEGVLRWNMNDSKYDTVGGISAHDGYNLSGDWVGSLLIAMSEEIFSNKEKGLPPRPEPPPRPTPISELQILP